MLDKKPYAQQRRVSKDFYLPTRELIDVFYRYDLHNVRPT